MKHSVPLIIFLGVCSILGFYHTSNVTALSLNSKNNRVERCAVDALSIFGEISQGVTIKIDGIDAELYCQFIDNGSALERFIDIEKDALEEIATIHKIEELTGENWRQYQAAIPGASASILSDFFDIYENTELNNQIIDTLSSRQKLLASGYSEEDFMAILTPMLPYYDQLSQDNLNMGNSLGRLSLPDVNAAVAYAENYAWSPNTPAYQYFNGNDCTNFASQILEAGGVSQDLSTSEYYGWWHRKNGSTHTHSVSWINTDTFARYMGVGYSTNRILNLSMNIQVGDFLVLDNTSDGNWDHAGFVTYKASTPGTYGSANLTYYDFIIAQHSNNYNMWISENGNNWELYSYEIGGYGTYGRVRR